MAAAGRSGCVKGRSQKAVYTVQSGLYLTCLPVVRRACALLGVIVTAKNAGKRIFQQHRLHTCK